ncbi:DUF4397 domain-containing protein [Thalassotalea agarivorans]|uniref:DUF4397 domain-containing protein n=1 Tax=Thalassotalea agarivorans TaxID=349064 RepID=A0A1I0G8H5_THASX|nr:DUF4397 domain-containing protein [Thalassotalea agarivorans]SET66215.1 hypothetical protein SAMN05660429_02326 [Thalassotalea agarivorans]
MVTHVKYYSSLLFVGVILTLLSACSDDESTSAGHITFYNASNNSPALYLYIDDDLSDESYEYVKALTNISFADIGRGTSIDAATYHYELSRKDDDSSARDDLLLIEQGQVGISGLYETLLVLTGDITTPMLTEFQYPIIEDAEDVDEGRANVRFIQTMEYSSNIEVYISEENESFEQAEFVSTMSNLSLSDNIKFDYGYYLLYLVDSNTSEVLFESDAFYLTSAVQYVLSIRQNTGVGSSPFMVDKLYNSTVETLSEVDAESSLALYNAVPEHELLPSYSGLLDGSFSNKDTQYQYSGIAYQAMSNEQVLESGDYALSVSPNQQEDAIVENLFVSLDSNSKQTLFLYLEEEYVDDDGDGDYDENNDGVVDEISLALRTLFVTNSRSQNIYEHTVSVINLIDTDDISSVKVYFVRNNETIASADYLKNASYALPTNITLPNNSYDVYVIGKQGTSDVLIANETLTLNEESPELFLLLTKDYANDSQYSLTFTSQ